MEQATAVVADGGAFLTFVDKAISYIESIQHGNPTWAWTVEQVFKCCRAHPKGVPEDELLMTLDLSWSEELRFTTAKTKIRMEGSGNVKDMLQRDAYGAIDFSRYPIRTYVRDLCGDVVGVSLFGTVNSVARASETTFCLEIEDVTGVAKIYIKDWSLGRVGIDHMVYISGVIHSLYDGSNAQIWWHADHSGSMFVNLSLLPALLNSKYLHDVTYLSEVKRSQIGAHICCVLVSIIYDSLELKLVHRDCGTIVNERPDALYCPFCQVTCDNRCMYSFQFCVNIEDTKRKGYCVGCAGPAAEEIFQISPARYMELSKDGIKKHVVSCNGSWFMVALAPSYYYIPYLPDEEDYRLTPFEITAAQKFNAETR